MKTKAKSRWLFHHRVLSTPVLVSVTNEMKRKWQRISESIRLCDILLCLSAVLVWEYNREHLSYQCRYRLNQHLIVLSLCNVSINKILITEFITVKVSQNFIFDANTMKWNQQLSRYVFSKVSNVWNKTFENKSIAKDHRVQNINWVYNFRIEICKKK